MNTDLINTGTYAELEQEMLHYVQADCPVTHRFSNGIYVREVFMPAGAFIIGHWHNEEHLNIMLCGKLNMVNEQGEHVEISAPFMTTAPAGRKMAHIIEDTIWCNVYATDEQDVEKLEKKFLTKSKAFSTITPPKEITADFIRVIEKMGFDEPLLRKMSDSQDDSIKLPYGQYKFMVADSNIEGKGVFATGNYSEGELIAPARIGNKRTSVGRYINHSCEPNAVMVKDKDNINLIALKTIAGCLGGQLGEEITVNYEEALTLQGV